MRDYTIEHTGVLHGKYGDKGHEGCPGCQTAKGLRYIVVAGRRVPLA